MDGRTDRRTGGRTDERTDGRPAKWAGGRSERSDVRNTRADEWTVRQTNEWMDGWMVGWIGGAIIVQLYRWLTESRNW